MQDTVLKLLFVGDVMPGRLINDILMKSKKLCLISNLEMRLTIKLLRAILVKP